jgi:hypothetical protein
MAAAVAGDEPQTAANRPQARMLAITSPPGTRTNSRCRDSNMSAPARLDPIAAPSRMNMGMVSSAKPEISLRKVRATALRLPEPAKA